ncbi:MAG: ABC transporter substrate-binding protein [Peptoniphilaceae bacterium]|nr:ABC transporter substrate-binding protein [Peptoniphilaceae bacterium]MDY3076441.1 ABC transporter substrate-binding protein [Peptoniphilaceae bacterium]
MKKRFRIASGIMASIMILGLTACGSKNSSMSSNASTSVTSGGGNQVKIAVAAPLTGDNSEYGIGFNNAVQMKADEWNKKGTLNIIVEKFDDKNSPEEGVSVANKIVSDKGIHGVIGHFASGVCMAAAPIYQDNQVIEISPSASHPDYSGIGDYIFRNNTVIDHEAKASLDIAVNDLGKKNIGIISIKTDWGVSTAKIVTDLISKMEADGVKLTAHEEVIEGSDDYRSAITKLNDAGTDVLICVGMYNLVAPVTKQYKEINPNIEVVGFSNSYSQELIKLGGEAVNGVAFPVIFFSESDDPMVKEFVENYKKKFGSEPSALTAQAYDSAGIYFTAVEKVGIEDPQKIRDEIASLTYQGVTGEIKFNGIGDVTKQFTHVIIQNGKFVELKK